MIKNQNDQKNQKLILLSSTDSQNVFGYIRDHIKSFYLLRMITPIKEPFSREWKRYNSNQGMVKAHFCVPVGRLFLRAILGKRYQHNEQLTFLLDTCIRQCIKTIKWTWTAQDRGIANSIHSIVRMSLRGDCPYSSQ